VLGVPCAVYFPVLILMYLWKDKSGAKCIFLAQDLIFCVVSHKMNYSSGLE
jgi:hypothetical protein